MEEVRGNRSKAIIVGVLAFIVWAVIHIPALTYGTSHLPLHESYIGDEQSPVNGALHILEDKSLLGFRNLPTVYYGPVFSIIALPAVVADFATKFATGAIHSSNDYKNYILWDWGGIVSKMRLISVIAGFLALWALYALLMTRTVNPSQKRSLAVVGVVLLACNFYFFEYSSFFKHWVYVITGLIGQIYFLVKIVEDREHTRTYYIWQGILFVGTFGISYLSVLTQIIFLPVLIKWLKEKDKQMLRAFGIYLVCLIIPLILIVWWHPRSFLRLVSLTTGDAIGADLTSWTSEPNVPGFSFSYYAQIIFDNHVSLLALWLLLVYVAIKNGEYKNYVFWLPISTALIYFVVFSIMGHHESRYILPAIVSIIVSSGILLVQYFSRLTRLQKISASTLIVAYIIFHLITLGFWQQQMMNGPYERKAISAALTYQNAHPQSRQLFISWYLLGYPHTKEAYKYYLDNYILARSKNHTGNDLYTAMLGAPLPSGIMPLNVYYLHPNDATNTIAILKHYDRVIYEYKPSIEQHLPPDFLEVDLTRYWLPEAWGDKYFTLKK
jgi:hypothetical protein